MFLPNPGILAAGAGRTYAEFVAHITALATSGEIAWTATVGTGATGSVQRVRTTAASFSGQLYGSPAGGRVMMISNVGWGITVARFVQHSLPDGDLSGAAAGRQVYLEIEQGAGTPELTGKTVNGFTSQSLGAGIANSGHVRRVIWWDGARAMWRDPSTNSAPEPYEW